MKTRRINKQCLNDGHDWDVYGHPNWVCNRPGCSVRIDDFGGSDSDIANSYVPVSTQ